MIPLIALAALGVTGVDADDPLPSWNAGSSKDAIVQFVAKVTTPGPGLPEPERIAVFDNDGTLWGEQPLYFQLAFALDRVKALAAQHPEWKDKGEGLGFYRVASGGRKDNPATLDVLVASATTA